MNGKLTTHVLDTAQGCPAAGMTIELYGVDKTTEKVQIIKTLKTNDDGRADQPLLTGDQFKIGCYEIVFLVGEYFDQSSLILPDPPFLDRVPIRFGIADLNAHYHVPLLVSPWSYSTYRGS
ncbi:MAG: hydroxyisourate hydrolase [Microcoleaceae cyanobacterium]